MPTPRKGQSKQDYMKSCPSIVINEGTTKDYKQAYAICESLWKQHHKKAKSKTNQIIDAIGKEILKNDKKA